MFGTGLLTTDYKKLLDLLNNKRGILIRYINNRGVTINHAETKGKISKSANRRFKTKTQEWREKRKNTMTGKIKQHRDSNKILGRQNNLTPFFMSPKCTISEADNPEKISKFIPSKDMSSGTRASLNKSN